MPEAVDQTSPLDAGHTTTEYFLAKVVTFSSAAIAVLSTVATFIGYVSPMFQHVPEIAKWVAISAAAVGALTQFAYGVQRLVLKLKAIEAGQKVVETTPVITPVVADDAAKNLGV